MEEKHRTVIKHNRVVLIKDTIDAAGIADYLCATTIFTQSMVDDVQVAQTPSEKNRRVYDTIVKRGPAAFNALLNALVLTGNGHLATLLRGSELEKDPPTRSEKGIFESLALAIARARPVKTISVRSNDPVYKVSVNMYSEPLPKSRVGIYDLPYTMALYKGTPKDSVTRWPGCPTGLALDKAYETYEAEVTSAMHLLNSLVGGSLEIESRPVADMKNALMVLEKAPRVCLDRFNPSLISENEKKRLAMTLHLITFGRDMKIMVRRDFPPKPSAYLFYNPYHPDRIVKEKDRQIVFEIIGKDESNIDGSETPIVPCPF